MCGSQPGNAGGTKIFKQQSQKIAFATFWLRLLIMLFFNDYSACHPDPLLRIILILLRQILSP